MALGATLARLIGADAEVALAMYESMQNPRARRDALLAAARVVLTEAECKTFAAVQKRVQGTIDERNRFAHWIWAHDTETDDCLYFIDPRVRQHFERNFVKLLETGEGEIGPVDAVLIYEQSDLQEVIDRLTSALALVSKLHDTMLGDESTRSDRFTELEQALSGAPVTPGDLPSLRLELRPNPSADAAET